MSRHVSHKSLGGALTRPAGHQGGNARARGSPRGEMGLFNACFSFACLSSLFLVRNILILPKERGSFFFSLIDLFGVEILLRMMIFGIS